MLAFLDNGRQFSILILATELPDFFFLVIINPPPPPLVVLSCMVMRVLACLLTWVAQWYKPAYDMGTNFRSHTHLRTFEWWGGHLSRWCDFVMIVLSVNCPIFEGNILLTVNMLLLAGTTLICFPFVQFRPLGVWRIPIIICLSFGLCVEGSSTFWFCSMSFCWSSALQKCMDHVPVVSC
jgi:hypothetical protein